MVAVAERDGALGRQLLDEQNRRPEASRISGERLKIASNGERRQPQ
jgi:hypothetical protein